MSGCLLSFVWLGYGVLDFLDVLYGSVVGITVIRGL